MNQLFAPPKPAKFETVVVGSTIRLADANGEEGTFEALVLEVHEEYGGFRLPALAVLREGADVADVVVQNGRWRLEVLISAGDAGSAIIPNGAFTVVPKTVESVAVEFTGGARQAAQLVTWAAGRAVLNYEQGDAIIPERLVLRTVTGGVPLGIGDYLICEGDTFSAVAGGDLNVHYKRAQPK